jgi:hypothetical protein
MNVANFEPLRGTERAQAFSVSPDSKWIQFTARASERSAETQLYKMPVDGSSPPVPVAKRDDDWAGAGMWRASGNVVVFTSGTGKEFIEVALDGGTVSKPKKFVSPGFEGSFALGQYTLPGDRAALVTATYYEKGLYQQSIGA